MKKFAFAAALLATSISAPAFAQGDFAGGKANALVGYDSIEGGGTSFDGVVFGAALGYDLQSNNFVYGVEAELTDSSVGFGFANASRDIYGGARLGVAVSDDALVYGKVGYTNFRISGGGGGINLDGVRAGAGLEYNVGSNIFLRGEYRYSNYEFGISRHQGVASLGVKF